MTYAQGFVLRTPIALTDGFTACRELGFARTKGGNELPHSKVPSFVPKRSLGVPIVDGLFFEDLQLNVTVETTASSRDDACFSIGNYIADQDAGLGSKVIPSNKDASPMTPHVTQAKEIMGLIPILGTGN